MIDAIVAARARLYVVAIEAALRLFGALRASQDRFSRGELQRIEAALRAERRFMRAIDRELARRVAVADQAEAAAETTGVA